MHDDPASRAAADRLDAAWDALVLGSSPAPPSSPDDADRTALLARIDALAPTADRAANARVRRRVFPTRQEFPMRTSAIPPAAATEHPPLPLPAALQWIVALSLILATVGTILLIPQNDERPSLPAASSPVGDAGTPGAEQMSQPLVDLHIDGRENTPLVVVVSRVMLQPGASVSVAMDEFLRVAVPINQYVESGTLTVEENGQGHDVGPGQTFGVEGGPDSYSNRGTVPVEFILMEITRRDSDSSPVPPDGSYVVIGTLELPRIMDGADRTVTLHRAETSTRGVSLLPEADGASPMLVAVERGAVRVRAVADAVATWTSDGQTRFADSIPPEGVEVTEGESLGISQPAALLDVVASGDDAVSALVLTVGVSASGESPNATVQASNTGQPLFTLGAPVVDGAGMPSVVIQRVTLPPGSTWVLPTEGIQTAFFVEEEFVVFERDGFTYPVPMNSSFPTVGGSPNSLSAPSSRSATFLIGTLPSTDAPVPPAGATVETIVAAPVPRLEDTGVIDVTLHRVDVSGDGEDPFPNQPGVYPMAVAVESGVLRINTAPGALVNDDDILTGRNDVDSGVDASTPTSDTWISQPGTGGWFVEAGESLLVERPYDITRLESVGDQPVRAFVLTVGVRQTDDAPLAMSVLDTYPVGEGPAPGSAELSILNPEGDVELQLYQLSLDPLRTVRIDAEDAVILQALDGQVDILSDSTPSTLAAGSAASFTSIDSLVLSTSSVGPAAVIVGLMYNAGHPPDPIVAEGPGAAYVVPLGSGTVTLAPGESTLRLSSQRLPSRQDAAPMAAASPPDREVATLENEATLMGVMTGTVVFTRQAGQVTLVPHVGGTGVEYPLGAPVTTTPGKFVIAQPRSAYAFGATGTADAVVATLSIRSRMPLDMTNPGPRGDELLAIQDVSCDVTPRSVDELRAMTASPPTGVAANQLPNSEDLGQPVNLGLREEIGDAVEIFVRCAAAGTPLQQVSLFSDAYTQDALASMGMSEAELEEFATASETINPPEAPAQLLFGVFDVQVYPDGRVGALVLIRNQLADITLVFDAPTGRWLVDAWEDRPREAAGAATPVP